VISSDATKLRCVANKVLPIFLTIDTKNQIVDFGGEIFYDGKLGHDEKGSYRYTVKFEDDSIGFYKSFYKQKHDGAVYGAELDRQSLILTTHFYQEIGFWLALGGGVPAMQCEILKKQL
jgi:hypothetical protein